MVRGSSENKSLRCRINIQLPVVSYADVHLSVRVVGDHLDNLLPHVPGEQPFLLFSFYLQQLRLPVNLWQ